MPIWRCVASLRVQIKLMTYSDLKPFIVGLVISSVLRSPAVAESCGASCWIGWSGGRNVGSGRSSSAAYEMGGVASVTGSSGGVASAASSKPGRKTGSGGWRDSSLRSRSIDLALLASQKFAPAP